MGKIEVRLATVEDAPFLALSMREIDRREMSAMSGLPDTTRLRVRQIIELIRRSDGLARVALLDGRHVCIWGVIKPGILAIEAHPWMLATDLIEDPIFSRAFVRRCRKEFEATIPRNVIRLYNFTATDNAVSMNWLRWIGFDFGADRYDHNGILWVRFDMEGQYVH